MLVTIDIERLLNFLQQEIQPPEGFQLEVSTGQRDYLTLYYSGPHFNQLRQCGGGTIANGRVYCGFCHIDFHPDTIKKAVAFSKEIIEGKLKELSQIN